MCNNFLKFSLIVKRSVSIGDLAILLFDNGMGTVDPPDLPLSPTKVGSSLGEAQGSDRLVKNGGDFTEVLDVTKSLGIKDSEMVGSSDLSLKALNQKVMMEEQAQVLIKSKGSVCWCGSRSEIFEEIRG